jgi:hypothetical protein
MFSKLSRMLALKKADSALEKRQKVVEAIERETGRLLKLIERRVEADRNVIINETAESLGEVADVEGARREAAGVMTDIEKQGRLLAGLRSRMAGMAGELESAVREVQRELPQHIQSLRDDFAREWEKARVTFSGLQSKRAALEKLVGRMDLAEPVVEAIELTASEAPWKALSELRAALDQVAGWSRAAMMPAVDAQAGPIEPYSTAQVYVLTRDCDNLAAGTMVMDSVLPPGMLNHLVQIGYANPLSSVQWDAVLQPGAEASRKLAIEARDSATAAFLAAEPQAGPYPKEDLEESVMAAAELSRIRDVPVPWSRTDV